MWLLRRSEVGRVSLQSERAFAASLRTFTFYHVYPFIDIRKSLNETKFKRLVSAFSWRAETLARDEKACWRE